MNRFKNQILLAAGFAVLAGVISGITAAPAIAQAIKAALIKNVDEKGRVPYSVRLACSTTSSIFCGASAPVVPAGKRLVIEHVNGRFNVPTSTLPFLFVIQKSGGTVASLPFQLLYSRGISDKYYAVNETVLLYFEPGEVMNFAMEEDGNVIGGEAWISGYLVDLTI